MIKTLELSQKIVYYEKINESPRKWSENEASFRLTQVIRLLFRPIKRKLH